jgi:hypothetical protein
MAAYARAVLTFPITTVFIECLFSVMNRNQDGRESLLDDTVASIIKSHELVRVLTSSDGQPEPALRLDFQRSLAHNLDTAGS